MSVQFTEEEKQYVATRRFGASASSEETGMTAFLVRNGIVASKTQGQFLLVVLSIVAIVASVFIFHYTTNLGTPPVPVPVPLGYTM